MSIDIIILLNIFKRAIQSMYRVAIFSIKINNFSFQIILRLRIGFCFVVVYGQMKMILQNSKIINFVRCKNYNLKTPSDLFVISFMLLPSF